VIRGTLNKLRLVATRRPGDARAWHALGARAIEVGSVNEAKHAFLKSVRLAPGEIQRALAAARSLAAAGCDQEAEQIIDQVLEHAPGHLDAHIWLARLHLHTHRESDAIAVLARALGIDPRCEEAHLLAASAHEQLGTLAEAANHLARVLAGNPDHLDANRRLGAIFGRLGDWQGSVRHLRRVVALTRSEDLDALTLLGMQLSNGGQHADAIEVLQNAVSRRGGVCAMYADLGMALLAAGRLDEALGAMSHALQLDPRSAQPYCGLGLCYQKMGRWKEAAEAFMSTEQLAPELAVGPFNLGLALQALGDSDGARRALLRAAALEPNDQEIRGALETFVIARPRPIDGSHRADAADAAFSASITGDLATFPLPDVLEFLRFQSKSGALAVTSDQGAGVVRMIRGRVINASAPGVKRIGEALVEGGVIARARLNAVLAQRNAEARPARAIGSVLLRDRLVEREQIAKYLYRQLQSALQEMLNWREGAFAFHAAEDGDPPPIAFDLQHVMLDLTRVGDERKQSVPKSNR
jgi:tetratricopeptide (TPR) repeat protein